MPHRLLLIEGERGTSYIYDQSQFFYRTDAGTEPKTVNVKDGEAEVYYNIVPQYLWNMDSGAITVNIEGAAQLGLITKEQLFVVVRSYTNTYNGVAFGSSMYHR